MLSVHVANSLDGMNSEIRPYMLSQLIIQWFDDEYSWSKESEVRQILSTFFSHLVIYGKK